MSMGQPIKKIGGDTYRAFAKYDTKHEANMRALKLRAKGISARVVSRPTYYVYIK